MEQTSDVWNLESNLEQEASDILSAIADSAIKGDTGAREYLTGLWDGEPWESIKEKLETEGSAWVVWWMDGVRKYISERMEGISIQAYKPEDLTDRPWTGNCAHTGKTLQWFYDSFVNVKCGASLPAMRAAVSICRAYAIAGLSDPAYIANVIERELKRE